MNEFKYSKEELELNKVLKMNLDESQAMLSNQKMGELRSRTDDNIKSSIELLKSLGKKPPARISSVSNPVMNCPTVEDWDVLVQRAEEYYPAPVMLEDFMSEQEIQAAFQELNDINQAFSQKTSIVNKTDLVFLAIATALQVVKVLVFPYVAEKFDYGKGFDPNNRLAHNDPSIEKAHREANDKFRDKHLKKHAPGYWINILYQTVPYDIVKGSKAIGINMGGKYHRMYTLGHDPILGWLFGTANILTDCITFNTFQTNRVARVDPITGAAKMHITPEIVGLGSMFNECYDMIQADYLNLPAALFAQAQHLKSDEYTKVGLPVPILSSINEDFASKLYKENYDALCFGRDVKIIGVSFVVSKIIDIIISLTHGLFRKPEESKDLYEVRTRKILLISNSIASTSTIINAIVTENLKNLDIGSLLNTLTHLFSDIRFITRIKQEYINSEISSRLQLELDEADRLWGV